MSTMITHSPEETHQNRKYWLHRISHEWHVSYKLLAGGYLSVGWYALAGSGIEKTAGDCNMQRLEATMIEYGYQVARSRWSLHLVVTLISAIQTHVHFSKRNILWSGGRWKNLSKWDLLNPLGGADKILD